MCVCVYVCTCVCVSVGAASITPSPPSSFGALARDSITKHDIGNRGFYAVADLVAQTAELKLLDLSHNKATPVGATRLCEALSINSTLLSLE